MDKQQLILASGSPRRFELFSRFWGDLGFKVMVPEFDEESVISDGTHLLAGQLVEKLSEGKLMALAAQYELPESCVAVAADTVVISEGLILGKPKSDADASDMLKRLSCRTHQVITGMSLLAKKDTTSKIFHSQTVTEVTFDSLSQEMIDWYIATGEPFDKAGAYGIQGHGSALIKEISGCYYNVMGLPVNRLMAMLKEAASFSSDYKFISDFLPWN